MRERIAAAAALSVKIKQLHEDVSKEFESYRWLEMSSAVNASSIINTDYNTSNIRSNDETIKEVFIGSFSDWTTRNQYRDLIAEGESMSSHFQAVLFSETMDVLKMASSALDDGIRTRGTLERDLNTICPAAD